jgi:hypothetical protein
MNSEDEWLAQLRQVYEADRARQQAEREREAYDEAQVTAEQLLQQCKAHGLVRQVQKTLLDGGGQLHFYQDVGGYEQAIVLMWAGPISDARKPAKIADVDASIIVGANDGGVFVNDEKLADVSPDGLRRRLLEVAQRLASEQKP